MPETASFPQVSRDTLFSGKLFCLQHRDGYRYSLDAILLAHFISPKPQEKILDLGSGCGIVSLLIAYRWPSVSICALEIQRNLVVLIDQNRKINHFEKRIEVIEGDFVEIGGLIRAGGFDRVVCNPPYGKIGCGRKNPGAEQAIARHEIRASLADVVNAAFYALKNGGRAAFIYPAGRFAALMACLKEKGLEPKRLQPVYSYPGDLARLVLVEAVKDGGEEVAILPPFYVYESPGGEYSPEMARLYQG